MNIPKDLTREAPRSPRLRIGGYAILARCLDKGRAQLAGTAGEFHYGCPLDEQLFNFKGVKGDEILTLLRQGASDGEVAAWLDGHGTPRTPADIAQWSSEMEANRPFHNPDKREWFAGECDRLGLNPATTTLFDYLEADDLEIGIIPPLDLPSGTALEQALQRGARRVAEFVAETPGKALATAAAAGYVLSLLPLGAILRAKIRLLAAFGPPALVAIGASRVVECVREGCQYPKN